MTVMLEHPTAQELIRWRRGEVAEPEVIAIAQHLATCRECTSQWTQRLAVVADTLCTDIEGSTTQSRQWPLLIAAAIAIALIGSLLWTRKPEPVVVAQIVRQTQQPPSSQDAVARVAEIARSLRQEPDKLRGTAQSQEALAPSAVVVASARPEFRWPAPKGATSEVQVFRGDAEVAHSGALRTSAWRPPNDFARGVTYTWTVRIEHGGELEILPESPDPIARFHVLDETTLAELRRSPHPEAQRVLREIENW